MRWWWVLGILVLMSGAAWADVPAPGYDPRTQYRPPPLSPPPPSFWAALLASLATFWAGFRRRLRGKGRLLGALVVLVLSCAFVARAMLRW